MVTESLVLGALHGVSARKSGSRSGGQTTRPTSDIPLESRIFWRRKGRLVIKLSEFFPPRPESSWKLVKQAGVDHAVGILNGGEHDLTMFQSVGSSGWAPDARD